MTNKPSPPVKASQPATSRRAVVRAAAHAAWAIPVVSVATAAPALAASGSPTLTIVTATYYWTTVTDPAHNLTQAPTLVPYVMVRNNGSAPVAPLYVGIAFPSTFEGPDNSVQPLILTSPGGGWDVYVQPPDGPAELVIIHTLPSLDGLQTATLGAPQPGGGSAGSQSPVYGVTWAQGADQITHPNIGAMASYADLLGFVEAPLTLESQP